MSQQSAHPPLPVTVAIIAKNEARHLAAALASVTGWVNEVLVLVDAGTTDDTAAIAAAHGARVETAVWRGFPGQRNLALALATQPWVFFLDADERVEPALQDALRALVPTAPLTLGGAWVPRHNVFFGRVLVGGGWYPDYQLRLVRRAVAHYDESRAVREVATVHGDTITLSAHLRHINIETFDELRRKQAEYARREAQTLHAAGRRLRGRNYIGAPLREFVLRYVTNGGWRDGWVGAVLAVVVAWYALQSFVLLGRIQQTERAQ